VPPALRHLPDFPELHPAAPPIGFFSVLLDPQAYQALYGLLTVFSPVTLLPLGGLIIDGTVKSVQVWTSK